MSSIRSSLAGARGLGSAKTGTGHFWAQRVSAIALAPLTLWFVACLASQFGASYESVTAWLSSPIQASLLAIYMAAIFYHAQLGLQTILEDYVHAEGIKMASMIGLQLLNILLAVSAVVSILMILVGAA
ncbi:succinate dehydrogenase, hydrophobic membrane anchor protein [Salinisphaera japonica]|uniref:Succinate dehydrogenase hydrophobic membrane anchor subunit n=1 Tax=Salinisphaera japonica YTM-1 TaxID=1209778 RepID=A0A423Q2F0_9GAMM|nr:succinate dehydrogenase, hydrophobic membrane anchor protein [Salinisphaera japonica]ROO32775.1 succinate dehydrogenase [Salinisphaera japonica YTM-1]|tara:strand:+ start:178 stop:564 length:387 start_codon:yes stop_codon:yes gene_type:complete